VERKFVGTIESDPSEALGLPIRVAMHRVFQLVCVIAGTTVRAAVAAGALFSKPEFDDSQAFGF
jgi:hypothetical protein